MPNADDPLYEQVHLQVHRHSHTCKMKKKKRCRFGFPKLLLGKSILLELLSTAEFTQVEINTHKAKWDKTYTALYKIHEADPVTYEVFFAKL